MAAPVSVAELLDGHVALEVECLDRIYLNAYVPRLQVGGQVAVAGVDRVRTGDVPRGMGGGRRDVPDPGLGHGHLSRMEGFVACCVG